MNGNILDLICTDCPIKFRNIFSEEGTFSSDHHVINFTMDMKVKALHPKSAHVFNFKDTNWEIINGKIRSENLSNCVQNHSGDVNLACQDWSNRVKKIMDDNIKKVKIKNVNTPPWIDSDVMHQSHKKEFLRKRAKTRQTEQSWAKYRKARNDLKAMVNNKYVNYINSSADDIATNPKKFWKIVKQKTKSKHIPDRVRLKDRYFSNDTYKATA